MQWTKKNKRLIKIISDKKIGELTSNLMKKHGKILEEKFKNLNKVNGIVANLFVTAETCTILNWYIRDLWINSSLS